jgi:hypothetical protein
VVPGEEAREDETSKSTKPAKRKLPAPVRRGHGATIG